MNAKLAAGMPQATELKAEFESLLYREAELLDEGRLDDWLGLIADTVRYWVPVRMDQMRGTEDFSRPGLMAHLDEDKQGLTYRVRRIQSGATFTDEPPPRVRHFVSNVRAACISSELVQVASNFMVYRNHRGVSQETIVGTRKDKWRRAADTWKLEERLVILDNAPVPTLAIFF
jgi:3-phenylpropionate/cinnamic acid dioxygenase small subunit